MNIYYLSARRWYTENPGVIVRIVPIFIIIFIFPSLLFAKREHPEKWYQAKWCEEQKGKVEVVLPDGTRCDCVTDTHAIEFDFGSNWAEVLIMSIFYRFDYSTNKLINHLTKSLYWKL